MNNSILKSIIGTAAVTGAALYLLDPVSGRRRRSLLRDQLIHALGTARHGIDVAGRDFAHRARGVAARAYGMLASREVSDEVLAERVRAAVGRAVSHPGAIDVSAKQGRVVLAGPILSRERRRLMRTLRAVRGVIAIEDKLDAHDHAGRISGLQGGRPRPNNAHVFTENWSPALRLLATIGGGALVLQGARQRGMLGLAAAAAGSALALRATTNLPLARLAGTQGRRAIDVRKTIHVRAPVEEVFAALSRYENFPAVMRNVRRVSVHPDGRSHWVVAGPAGVSVEWDAETTACRPNELLAWRTVRHATVEHAGVIRLQQEDSGTRLDMRMTYNPPAGVLGHVIAKLCGADAKTELDEDLMRLKSFLETGVEPHDAAAHRAAAAAKRSHRPVFEVG